MYDLQFLPVSMKVCNNSLQFLGYTTPINEIENE